ncbi:MAG: exodeoxyribonuclease V subunit gamma [Treponema sp.]|nr:exodeoxyribonuclease V subunit gamma [Treponema sp.]
MKNVYTCWNLEILADKMIEKILDNWKNPFFSPAIVFTDAKSEQWFKLHWMQKASDKNPVLLNLKTMRLQSFLFDISRPPQYNSPEKIERVCVELVRDVIISKLIEKNPDGSYYFEVLDEPKVASYIKNGNKINNIKLYDFAQQLASLFLDYEDTRPDTLEELFQASLWQAKLRKDIFGSEPDLGFDFGNLHYFSLHQIYNLNKKLNGNVKFNWNFKRPVFIFGFLGLGQLYRKILAEFAKQGDLYVYLQAGNIASEQSSNELINAWGDFGKECLELWGEGTIINHIKAEYSQDSLLHCLQNSIEENKPIQKNQQESDKKSLSLTGAPNRLREIENLHSQICKLLKDGKTQVGDILIVAQNIQDYKIAIEQVFDQNDKNSSDFPSLPYTIADYSADSSLTADAMQLFFSILQKSYLSRSDFFGLLRNSLVQTVRGITDESVSNWSEWTSDLNVYRGKNWQKAASRLLLSRLTDNPVFTDEENYLPYENINSQDNEALYQFLQAIEEMEDWLKLSEKEELTAADIDSIYSFLCRWLKLEDSIPPGMMSESFIFQNIMEEIERQKLMTQSLSNTNGTVIKDCFFFALLDRTSAASLHSANIFSSGVTFANFQANRILPAKYVFFLGLDSKSYPGQDKSNVLDLRSEHYKRNREKGDESIPRKNKNAFLAQLMAAKEGFFISYVNKDLRKDADFFPSSVVNELFSAVFEQDAAGKENIEEKINLDEDRPWKELFTQREFRNKENFLALKRERTEDEELESSEQQELLPDRVSISSVKVYLKDPFQFMASQVFSNDEDNSAEEREEFEPIDFSSLTSSELRKAYVQAKLENAESDFEQKLKDQDLLPQTFFGSVALEKIYRDGENLLEQVKEIYQGNFPIEFEASANLLQKYNEKDWHLTGRLAWYNQNFEDTKKLIITDFSKQKVSISAYVTALALLAGLSKKRNEEYSVSLYSINTENNAKALCFSMSKEEAEGILSAIYYYMFIEAYQTCIPDEMLAKKKAPESLQAFVSNLFSNSGQSGAWSYFAKRKMFDPYKDIGYTSANFAEEYSAAVEHQLTVLGRLHDENK